MEPQGEVTRLLSAWAEGDPQALDDLMPLVYGELHRIARRSWAGQPAGHTLQPTALIHEAYIKLASQGDRTFHSRAHFFAVASMAMRQILVNHAQSKLAQKRGSGRVGVTLDDVDAAVRQEAVDVLELNHALDALKAVDPRKCQVVELRYFGGLDIDETAEVLGVSPVTVTRDWQVARAWLARELGGRNGS